MRKRCQVGKSCGATCITRPDFCQIELPPPISKSLPLVREVINYNNKSYNWAELVSAVLIVDPTVNNKEDVIKAVKNDKIAVAKPDKYIENLKIRDNAIVEKYIENAKQKLLPVVNGEVKKVYILGATKQEGFPEVAALNAGLDKKQNKADVIVMTDKGPIGISVKSASGDRTTNFSLEKMTGEYGLQLRQTRKEYIQSLRDKGLTANQIRDDFAKKEGSPYTKLLEKFIDTHKSSIINEWIKGVGAENVHYPIHQFDGTNVKDQQELGKYLRANKDKIEIKLQPRTGRGTSLYYEVFVDGKKEFQWEFRKTQESTTTLETRVRTKEVKEKKQLGQAVSQIIKSISNPPSLTLAPFVQTGTRQQANKRILAEQIIKDLREGKSKPTTPKPTTVKETPKQPDKEKQIAGVKNLITQFAKQGYSHNRIREELRKLKVPLTLIVDAMS